MEIEKAGIHLVAISYDSVDLLKRVQVKHNFTFPLLSDEDSKTITAYGIRNKESVFGMPYPTTFIIDQKGVIRSKLAFEDYSKWHLSQNIIEAGKSAR